MGWPTGLAPVSSGVTWRTTHRRPSSGVRRGSYRLDVSTASVIEGVRLADALAALRGHPLAGLPPGAARHSATSTA